MKRIAILFAVAAAIMLGVFQFARWRAENALLPRYCEDPRAVVALVGRILDDGGPEKGEKRRPYLIAAKLIFLEPQLPDEPTAAYLDRLQTRIEDRCAGRF